MSITLKIYSNKNKSMENLPETLTSIHDFQQWFQTKYIKNPLDNYQCIVDHSILNKLEVHLVSIKGIDLRTGISGGCYGARTGENFEGLTVWVDASLVVDRFIDSDGDEVVNLKTLLEEYAEELENIDPHKYLETAEFLELKINHDNTYNYLGQSPEDPYPLQHLDFKVIENDAHSEYGPMIILVAFHCGGDIRGNYTDYKVYKTRDFHSIFSPTKILTQEVV